MKNKIYISTIEDLNTNNIILVKKFTNKNNAIKFAQKLGELLLLMECNPDYHIICTVKGESSDVPSQLCN